MNIAIHDYCGHPFQVELSRELAARGHQVSHWYCDSNPTTPKGQIARQPGDPANLSITGIKLPKDIEKGRFVERWRLERLYGARLVSAVLGSRPDLVICANTPLDALARLQRACRRQRVPFVFWVQDLIGRAAAEIMRSKLGVLGGAIGAYYQFTERRIFRRSDHIIAITDDFTQYLNRAGVAESRISVIPNWAPLGDILPGDKGNRWARRFGLDGKFVFLYSGTLGFKHNPALFLALAAQMRHNESVRIVVNSQGDAAQWLSREARLQEMDNLMVNPYQPYEEMSEVMASADVLVGILEPGAGKYSVPSKVLSYHCAARPILLAVPPDNLAARIVRQQQTGLVVDPADERGFCEAAQRLFDDGRERGLMAARARHYAEENFDAVRIATRFENQFRQLVQGNS
jgi:glycosyltransferase involved in cell wall biosynthesis